MTCETRPSDFDDQHFKLLRAKIFLERLYYFCHELETPPAAQDTLLIMIDATNEVIASALDANANMQRGFKGLYHDRDLQNEAA